MSDRYVVARVTGYSGASAKVPGVSLHILDAFYSYTVIASYRSEDKTGVGRGRLGHEGAERTAREHAARLNAKAEAA